MCLPFARLSEHDDITITLGIQILESRSHQRMINDLPTAKPQKGNYEILEACNQSLVILKIMCLFRSWIILRHLISRGKGTEEDCRG